MGVPIAADFFTPQAGSGWGDADLGGTWTAVGGSSLADERSISNGAGTFVARPGRSTQAVLRGASATDVSLRTTFSLPTPSGGAVYHGLAARVQSDGSEYRVRYVARPDGSAVLSTSKFASGQETYLGDRPVTGLSGQPVMVTMSVTGGSPTRIVATASAATSATPAAQSDVSDTTAPITAAGTVGLWTYLSGTASPLTVSTTSFVATRPSQAPVLTPPNGTATVRDDFLRTLGTGWGQANGQPAWRTEPAGAFSVDGAGALITATSDRPARATADSATLAAQVQTVFSFGTLPTGSDRQQFGLTARGQGDGSNYRGRVTVDAAGAVRIGVSRTVAGAETDLGEQAAGFGVAAGQPVVLEMLVTGADPVNITVRARTVDMADPARLTVADSDASRVTGTGVTGVAARTTSQASALVMVRSFWATELPPPAVSSVSRDGATPDPTSTPAVTSTVATTTTATSTAASPSAPTPSTTTSASTSTPATMSQPTPTSAATTGTPSPSGTTAGPSVQPTTVSTSATPTSTAAPTSSTAGPVNGSDPVGSSGSTTAGAQQPGSSTYPVPGDALFVAPGGSDAASGTLTAPLQSVQTAINRARTGQTVVLRAGTYHESVMIPQGKALTVQSYPGEAAWFDGSSQVKNWTKQGDTWTADNWTARFDASPTFTRGAADGTSPGWRFIDPNYPMAANPDQVWIDGVAQQQVAKASDVRAGTFAVDYGAKRIILGSDPSGHEIRASDLSTGIKVVGEGSTLRGFGVRNYAPSVPDFGAVSVWRPRVTVENVVITDSATIGLSIDAQAAVVRKVSVLNNGLMGLHVNYADDLTIDGVLARNNNDEHFNQVPAAGGIKITRSRNVVVRNSASTGNNATGLWFDESVYNIQVLGNDLSRNLRHGLVCELSAKVLVAGNTVTANTGDGILIVNTSGSRIWNNTVGGNKRNINLTQDARRASNAGDAGHDPRQPFPDPTMSWTISPAVISNNVIAGGNGASDALVGVQDFTKQMSAEQMGVTLNGNFYYRPADSAPRWVVAWSRGGGQNPFVATQLDAFTATTGQEKTSQYSTDRSLLDGSGQGLTAAGRDRLAAKAQPLPDDIAGALGWPAGTRRMGA